jgi:ArsR family transcriptional regulator
MNINRKSSGATTATGQVEDPTGEAIEHSAKRGDPGSSPRVVAKLAKLAELAEWLKVLSEPNRLRIVDLLMHGEQCNCEMGGTLGMAPNLISHHLSVLQRSGLVTARRDESDARWIHYSIEPGVLADLNDSFRALLNPARLRSQDAVAPLRCAPSSFASSVFPASHMEITTR